MSPTTLVFMLLVLLFAEPLDIWEASRTHEAVCVPALAQGSFGHGVEADYDRTGIAISALFWSDVDRKRYERGENCALRWAASMFGPALVEELYARIQSLKWKVGEHWFAYRGLFFRLKRDEEMAPEVGSWYLGVYGYGVTGGP